mmetsp:Transcript_20776/g.35408  ORF Transcript_20776/g.35408 Transcript_20776/m.35408 type:complete len:112 (+) Transcript_20776:1265-1600(+)
MCVRSARALVVEFTSSPKKKKKKKNNNNNNNDDIVEFDSELFSHHSWYWVGYVQLIGRVVHDTYCCLLCRCVLSVPVTRRIYDTMFWHTCKDVMCHWVMLGRPLLSTLPKS